MADEGWKKPIFIIKWMTKYFDSLMEKLDAIQNMFGTSGDADVSSADIRLGKKAYNGTTLVTGTMPENVAVAETLTAGEAYVIPQGYHDGTGKVTADSLASQTDGTATAAQILSGKTAYVDGVKVTGSMTNNGAKTASLAAGASYTIPAGYHDGTGKVTANSLASQTDGTATAAQILSGKTAYVDGKKVTGSMGNKAGTTVEASAVTQDDTNTYFNVPAGFYDANSKVYTPNSNLSYVELIYKSDGLQIGTTYTLAHAISNYKKLVLVDAYGHSSEIYLDYKKSTISYIYGRSMLDACSDDYNIYKTCKIQIVSDTTIKPLMFWQTTMPVCDINSTSANGIGTDKSTSGGCGIVAILGYK